MSQDFPTLAEVGEMNMRLRQQEHRFRIMMRYAPVDYHQYPPRREDHD